MCECNGARESKYGSWRGGSSIEEQEDSGDKTGQRSSSFPPDSLNLYSEAADKRGGNTADGLDGIVAIRDVYSTAARADTFLFEVEWDEAGV